jgi:hypothetical protein
MNELYLLNFQDFFSFFLNFSLHHNLIEHLNNEIVLRTVTNVKMAIQWLKSTYLYIRLKKDPNYYGAEKFYNEADVESYLEGNLL